MIISCIFKQIVSDQFMEGVYIMDWKQKAEKWLQYEFLDEVVKGQLDRIKSDEKSLEEAFYKNLEFGTGGMRGEIGAGTNRMNLIYGSKSICRSCCLH